MEALAASATRRDNSASATTAAFIAAREAQEAQLARQTEEITAGLAEREAQAAAQTGACLLGAQMAQDEFNMVNNLVHAAATGTTRRQCAGRSLRSKV